MRTTVTLDPDTRALVERTMRQRGLTFKEALNAAIRAGLAGEKGEGHRYTTPRRLGPARIDLTKALQAAGELEDEAIARRISERR